MDDLPVVVLQEILDFLSIQEKLRSKLICKKFKFVVETFCAQQNVCIYGFDYPYGQRWCWSDQRIADEDMLHLKFDLQISRPFDLKMEFFRNLQKICLYVIGEKVNQFLEEVHRLRKLKVLIVNESGKIKLRTLSSSSLEKLSLGCGSGRTPLRLELNTPKLSSVTFWMNYRQINFRFPLEVKHLRSRWFNPCLRRLKNLETLICERITSDFKLSDFKSLIRLEVFPFNEDDLQVVRQILDQRNRLDRDRPELFICGFKEQLPTCGKIYEMFSDFTRNVYSGLQPEYIEYAVKNYSNLADNLPWNLDFDIRTLLKCGNLIPRDFFQKFTRTAIIPYTSSEELKITESEQRVLVEHIKRSSPCVLLIRHLDMSLKREFYKQLSSVQSLKFLWIGPHLENVEFDHFLKLKHLQNFTIRSEKIPIQFVSKLFVHLKHLKVFKFQATCGLFDSKFRIEIWFYESPDDESGVGDDEEDEEDDEEAWRPFRFGCYYRDSFESYEKRVLFANCYNANELAPNINRIREDERLLPYLIE